MANLEGKDYSLAELCITACAEAFREDSEVLASGMGLVPRLGVGLAKLTFSPDLLLNDAECTLVSEPIPPGPRGDYKLKVEGWLPFRAVFDLLWGGRRHCMNMPTQLDRWGQQNISLIGDTDQPKVQLLGVRGIPGNSINHPSSFFIPNHGKRTLVEDVDMVSGVGHDPARWRAGMNKSFMELRRCVTNLAVLDWGGPDHQMRIVSLHPGVTVDDVQEATSFPLAVAEGIGETPGPDETQLRLIRSVIDVNDLRATVFPEKK
jgi:glutaconate CoA-transferase subunit B